MENLEGTVTLEEFISSGSDINITYAKLSMVDESGDLKIPIYNIVSDYMYELLGKAKTIELTNDQFWKYKYKPKLLAADIYGNSETYFIILLLNNMCSVKEFDIKKVKMLTKADMTELLGLIYSKEKDFLDQYNDKIQSNL